MIVNRAQVGYRQHGSTGITRIEGDCKAKALPGEQGAKGCACNKRKTNSGQERQADLNEKHRTGEMDANKSVQRYFCHVVRK